MIAMYLEWFVVKVTPIDTFSSNSIISTYISTLNHEIGDYNVLMWMRFENK